MILGKTEVINALKDINNVSIENDCFYSDGKLICTVDELVDALRINMGCDFEIVYAGDSDMGDNSIIYKCKHCGTVVFASDDEYDEYVFCPKCSKDEHYLFSFWTKEEIEADKEKQEYLKGRRDVFKYRMEYFKRMNSRGGLYDHEIFRKEFKRKGKRCPFMRVSLQCNNAVEKDYRNLHLSVSFWGSKYRHFYIETPLYYIKRLLGINPYK